MRKRHMPLKKSLKRRRDDEDDNPIFISKLLYRKLIMVALRRRGYIVEGSKLDGLHLDRVTEDGVSFETGVPVVFSFYRYQQKHVAATGYDQEFEPAGIYMSHRVRGYNLTPDQEVAFAKHGMKVQYGTASFRNPIVLRDGYGPSGWKQTLSKAFGGKKRKLLTSAIKRAGFDGIVTVGKLGGEKYTGEIVKL